MRLLRVLLFPLPIAIATPFASSGVYAQSAPGAPAVVQPSAPNPPPSIPLSAPAPLPGPEAGAPFAGANSFTETQARQRALDAGFADVGALIKDDQGIWRGAAMRDGKRVPIAVDYRGNVVASN